MPRSDLRKNRDHLAIQNYYDQGHTVVQTALHFNLGVMTLYNDRRNGLLNFKDRSNCQISKKVFDYDSIRLESLAREYANGSTYSSLRRMGFRRCEYYAAKKIGILSPRTIGEALKLRVKNGGVTYKPSATARMKTSIRQSIDNSGGRCKWFTVSGQRVQGTWERDLAASFNRNFILWDKCKKPWIYRDDNGNLKRYTPDFYLTELDLFLEIKGYWWGNDKRKTELAVQQNPDKLLAIVLLEDYKKLISGSVAQMVEHLVEAQSVAVSKSARATN